MTPTLTPNATRSMWRLRQFDRSEHNRDAFARRLCI
jgi:hypothetical protein